MSEMRTAVVVPAYNAERSLSRTLEALPRQGIDLIVIVDDGSSDGTFAVAKKLQASFSASNSAISVIVDALPQNRGYGGAQKRCYDLALKQHADIIVMIHSDNQYDASLAGELAAPIADHGYDLMLGTRIRSFEEARKGGMPAYKYMANRMLTALENLASKQRLSEWHTGMRAYSRHALEEIPYRGFSDDFFFDTQMLFAAAARQLRIGEIPVPVRYDADSSSISFMRSLGYGFRTLVAAARFGLGLRE